MKQYKLKEHVTDDMLKAVGYEIQYPCDTYIYCALKGDVLIPLENFSKTICNRIIQSRWLNMALKIDDIQDLIDLDYVEEVK